MSGHRLRSAHFTARGSRGGGKDMPGNGKNLLQFTEARKNTACLGWSKWFSPPGAYYALGWVQGILWGDLGEEAK